MLQQRVRSVLNNANLINALSDEQPRTVVLTCAREISWTPAVYIIEIDPNTADLPSFAR